MARIDLEDVRGSIEDCIALSQAPGVSMPERAQMVASYVRGLSVALGSVYVSQLIEDAALPGTFAEAVFNILAD